MRQSISCLIFAVIVICLASCSKHVTEYIPGPKGDKGDSVQGEKGDKGDAGTNGSNGNDGAQGLQGVAGTNGQDGASSLAEAFAATGCTNGGTTLVLGLDVNHNLLLDVTEVSSSATICNGTNGTNGTNGINGIDGQDGQDGQDGIDGVDGQDGVDGTNGTNGADAPPTAFTPVGLLDPCGDAPGIYDEVFLRLSNGSVLASFSDNPSGLNTRWSVLVPGTYSTTDNDGCTFTIDASGAFTYENHHW